MEQQLSTPVFKEMMTQINTFQKENMNQVIDTMNNTFKEKIPLKIFSVEKLADTQVPGYFSNIFSITEKMSREMLENSMEIMPALLKNDKDSFTLLKSKMTEAQDGFIEQMKGLVPDNIAESKKEKINNSLEKLAISNNATIEFLYSLFIPMWDGIQGNPGQEAAGKSGNTEKPKKKKTE